jgi:DnaJ family protein C protein 13
VEVACKGSFRLLFFLLNLSEEPKLQQLDLEVIAAVCASRECVSDIAESSVLVYLLFALQTLTSGRATALECFHAMVSNSKIVVEAINKGVWVFPPFFFFSLSFGLWFLISFSSIFLSFLNPILPYSYYNLSNFPICPLSRKTIGALIYLLDLFCNSTSGPVREATAALFGKMLADKLNGPRVRIVLSKFLPLIFTDAMRDNPEASVTMFEGGHENPELIWNDESRSKVAQVVAQIRGELYASQQKDPTVNWRVRVCACVCVLWWFFGGRRRKRNTGAWGVVMTQKKYRKKWRV